MMTTGGKNPAHRIIGAADTAFELPVGLSFLRRLKKTINFRPIFRQDMFQKLFVTPLGLQFLIPKYLFVNQRAAGGVIRQIQIPRANATRLQRKV